MNKEKYNVEELVYLCRQKDEEALELLIAHFRPFLSAWLRRNQPLFDPNVSSREDLLAMADALLVDCIERYRTDQNAGFDTFYTRAAHNLFIDQARAKSTKKNPYQHEIYSLDAFVHEEKKEYLSDYVKDSSLPVHESTMLKLHSQDLLQRIEQQLGSQAVRICHRKADGQSLRVIAEEENLSVKRVRTILEKVRKIAAKIDSVN